MKTVMIAAALLAAGLASAATPPAQINYQGVLRNSSDLPLNGSYDVIFRLFDAPSGGNEIGVDEHTSARPQGPVTVIGGLFNTSVGPTIFDGGGPGTYASLADIFRDFGIVYLEVQVGTEVLAPRTLIRSAAYALNAANLGGRAPSGFLDTSSSPQTKLGTATFDASSAVSSSGVEAYGSLTGGHFKTTGTGEIFAGHGDTGIDGYGTFAGGIFRSGTPASPGVGQAYLGYGDNGIVAYGAAPNGMAGYFKDSTGEVHLGIANTGIESYGTATSGIFRHGNPTTYDAEVRLGGPSYAIEASTRWTAAASLVNSQTGATATLASTVGISATGITEGGHFANAGHYNTSVAFSNGGIVYKVVGDGAVSFVQNHPEDPTKSIVYAAPEGDEVAVYTRGSGRLDRGEAHVALGETFRWVTNPEIGLTASVTARGECRGLYVASVSPTELVVRELGGGRSDASFDYVVWGLRVGFERMAVVQSRWQDDRIPSREMADQYYAAHPGLERFNALSRFTAMEGEAPAKGREAAKLAAAINRPADRMPESTAAATPMPLDEAAPVPPLAFAPSIPVGERVETGDVLVNDRAHPGRAIRAAAADDRGVLGIVAGDPGGTFDVIAPLALAGSVVVCKVDATVQPIEIDDLLVAAPIAGHAKRAGDTAMPGTVVGKAIDPLPSGTGLIRVLVMSR